MGNRYKELNKAIADGNTEGGMTFEKWVMLLLTDIALSLATISDTLTDDSDE